MDNRVPARTPGLISVTPREVEGSLRGIYGVRVATPLILPLEERYPPTFPELLQDALEAGSAYGREAPSLKEGEAIDAGRRRIQSLGLPKTGLSVGVWQLAARAMFWFGTSRAPYVKRRKHQWNHAGIFGARAQRDLTHALLALPDPMRSQLYRSLDHTNRELRHAWRITYNGAITTARVISVLTHLDARIYIPVANVDAKEKIDVIVCVPGERYLCMQVKSQRFYKRSSILLLPPPLQEHTPEVKLVQQAILRFGTRQGLRCIPCIVIIGHEGLAPWQVQWSASLRQKFAHLLENF